MHMISKKGNECFSNGHFDCSHTKVITAYGEVQTHEEATVYV